MSPRCALWARVSTDEQESGNQLAVLRAEDFGRGAVEAALRDALAEQGRNRSAQ